MPPLTSSTVLPRTPRRSQPLPILSLVEPMPKRLVASAPMMQTPLPYAIMAMEININTAFGLTPLSGMVAILTRRLCFMFIKINHTIVLS